jgi:hypothetical protein
MTDNQPMHADFLRILSVLAVAGSLVAVRDAFAAVGADGVAAANAASLAIAAQPAASEQELVRSFVARQLARAAMIDLRMTKDPQQADQLITAAYLRDASNLLPTDVHLARLAMTAASEAGDWNLSALMARRVLELDPRDTATQLRLIDLQVRLAEVQAGGDVAAGTRVLEGVLTQRGQTLDASVRSRAAHALALRRLAAGNEKGFVESLSSSLQLDASNKQAAATAVEYFLPRVQQPTPRVELLSSLLSADPLNPQVHLTLGEEFATGGAFRAALRFYRMGLLLAERTRMQVSGAVRADEALCRVRAGESATIGKRLTDQLESLRRQQRVKQDAVRAEGKVPPAEEALVRLGPELERARFVAAMVSQQSAIARASALELGEMALAETGAGRAAALSEAAFVLGWAQADGTRLAALKSELQAAGLESPDTSPDKAAEIAASMVRIDAWQKIAAGDAAGARAQLANAASDPLAQLILLQLDLNDEQTQQRVDEAITKRLAGMAQSFGSSPMGAWAAGMVRQRTGSDLAMGELANKLAAQASGIPGWIDQVVDDPARMVTLRATLERGADVSGASLARSLGDELEMVIRIRNRLPVPMAIGEGEPIDTRMLATVFFDPAIALPRQSADGQIFVSAGAARASAAMEVLDVQRRLRLMPNEELIVVVRPEAGLAGWAGQIGRGCGCG